MANIVRERLHGDVTYFNVNRHINPTDVCVASCRLCAFGKKARDPKAYTMSLEQVWETRRRGLDRGGHRVPHRRRAASGTDARLVLRDAARPEAALSAGAPEGVHDGGDRLPRAAARRSRSARCCERLKDAGMDSLPGGGAEIFTERVRRIICDHKIDGDEWLEIARTAHQIGLQSQLHDALRPHRERRGPRRSPGEAARAAGRDRRLRHLHSAGVPSRQHAAAAHPEDHRASTTSRTSRSRA